MDFAYADGLHRYHSPRDTLEHADPGSLQHHGEYALSLARYFGHRDLSLRSERNHVYFDVVGRWLVHYDEAGAFILAVACLLLFARVIRDQRLGPWLTAAFGFVLAVISALVVTFLTGRSLAASLSPWVIWPHAKLLFVGRALVHVGVLSLCAVLMNRREPASSVVSTGILAVWTGAATASVLAPGLSPMVQWPALFALVGAWLGPRFGLARDLAGALIGVLLGQLVYTLIVMDGGLLPVVPMLVLGPGIGLVHAVAPPPSSRWLKWAGVGGLSTGGVGLAVGGTTMAPTAENPRAVHLDYVYDADRDASAFATIETRPSAWLASVTDAETTELDVRARFTPSHRTWRSGPAPRLSVVGPTLGPTLEVRDIVRDEGRTRVDLEIGPAPNVACVMIWPEPDSRREIVGQAIDDAHYAFTPRFSPEIDRRLYRLTGFVTGPVRWRFYHCGLASSRRLELILLGDGPLALRVVSHAYGLPAELGLPPRPSTSMASLAGDRVLSTRRVVVSLTSSTSEPNGRSSASAPIR